MIAAARHQHEAGPRGVRASYGANRSIDEAALEAGMASTTLERYRRQGIEHIAAIARRKLSGSAAEQT